MVGKSYTEEFRRRAVDLYESTPGATLRQIAADLGIGRSTLHVWLREFGYVEGPVAAPGAVVVSGAVGESKAARIVRLEAENVKLMEERDILRAAAKYFAGETNW